MLFKLSARNLKKSMQNYIVYFVTLIIGVAVFYVFNSIESQTVMLNVSKSTKELINLMIQALSAISVFISFILGFLIVYASNFLMKRRKKEFGVYMLLGMGKKKIAAVIVIETVMIGIISLAIGILVGVVGSMGMSVVVANMFETNMTEFAFRVSTQAIVKTIIYFLVMYFIVILLNTVVVGKAKLINLLNANKRSEKNSAKNPIVCFIVFVVACLLLGTAYYNVTAGIGDLASAEEFVAQIVKGIIGTFLLFWSLSGILVMFAKKSKRTYFKGLNCFTIKELSSRINTTVFSGGIICLLIFFTICIFSVSVAMRQSENQTLKDNVNSDIMLAVNSENGKHNIRDFVGEKNIDISRLKDEVEVTTYLDEENINVATFATEGAFDKMYEVYVPEYVENVKKTELQIMKMSDYNKLAKLYGKKELNLSSNEYMIVADLLDFDEIYANAMKNGCEIKIGEKILRPADDEYVKGSIYMTTSYSNTGFVIIPDDIDVSSLDVFVNAMMANYDVDSKQERDELDKYYDETLDPYTRPGLVEGTKCAFGTKKICYDSAKGLSAMVVFIGSYLGIVFMISSGAILSLKELSEAVDNKDKYTILRKLGVEEKMITSSLFKQCSLFFGLPLVIAILHSVFGMKVAMFFLTAMGIDGILTAIILSASIILVIYGVYFVLTYLCCKKIIEE